MSEGQENFYNALETAIEQSTMPPMKTMGVFPHESSVCQPDNVGGNLLEDPDDLNLVMALNEGGMDQELLNFLKNQL